MDVVESVFWERKEKWYPNDKIADTTISSFAMTGSPLTQVRDDGHFPYDVNRNPPLNSHYTINRHSF